MYLRRFYLNYPAWNDTPGLWKGGGLSINEAGSDWTTYGLSLSFGFMPSILEGSSETLRNSRADKYKPNSIRKKTSIAI